jgi:hypothetical protein
VKFKSGQVAALARRGRRGMARRRKGLCGSAGGIHTVVSTGEKITSNYGNINFRSVSARKNVKRQKHVRPSRTARSGILGNASCVAMARSHGRMAIGISTLSGARNLKVLLGVNLGYLTSSAHPSRTLDGDAVAQIREMLLTVCFPIVISVGTNASNIPVFGIHGGWLILASKRSYER